VIENFEGANNVKTTGKKPFNGLQILGGGKTE